MFLGTYHYLDITPMGREENARGNMTDWVRHHDRYEDGGSVDHTGRAVAPDTAADGCHAAASEPVNT